jgi:hypothetical protein
MLMALPSPGINGIPVGQLKPSSTRGEFNNITFLVQQALGKMQTSTLVRVEACSNNGGVSPVGNVDVTPLVNQVDSNGNPTPHVTIYNMPYLRIQGGANAVIIDPQKGDIGICVFASRDISKVKTTRKQGNPGSFRQYSFSDGMYLGGCLNAAPTQYVQMNFAGIKIFSPNAIILQAPDIQLVATTIEINGSSSTTVTTPTFTVNGATTLNGTIAQSGGGAATFSGSITSTGDMIAQGTSLHNHIHPDPQGGNTGPPI